MKIVYASDSIVPSRSANSVHVMKMSQAFVQNGHEVCLVARMSSEGSGDDFKFYGVENKFNIKKLWWPRIKGGGFIYGWNFRRWIQNKGFDLVYGRSIYCLLQAARMDIKCVLESHTPPRNKAHHNMQKKLFSLSSFSHLVVISGALKERYKEIFPSLTDDQIIIAHDGADVVKDHKLEEVTLKGGKDALNVGYVGSLYSGKGMEAIVPLARSCGQINFHVVGGSGEDVFFWKKKAKDLENIFFYGHVPHSDIYQYLKAFDIMLAPYQNKVSTERGGKNDISQWMSPLKIFEYMSAGKPIIASDLPVLREVLKDGETAMLCDPQEVEDWIGALMALTDENIRIQISSNAKELFEEKYTWKRRASAVLKN